MRVTPRKLFLLLGVSAVLVGAILGAPPQAAGKRSTVSLAAQIEAYRRETWRWQTLMRRPRTPAVTSKRRLASYSYHLWVLTLWKARAARARAQAARPPHRRAWRCIQRYEADWDANTGNGYYGGLQMDLGFQRAHGSFLLRRKGTADNWTPLEQMWVAEQAYRSGLGFWPWPNTARLCGVL